MSPTTNVLPTENLLAQETSPYLVQHKDNPVHWRPWSKAALNEAKATNKPILLSIGYSACHWCHVMAHECFEDDEVAAVMNELFVNIKVDREERPDIDQIFMAALHATGEQGGWPLTMFLTPDGRPFWGGTYFPKRPKYGRPGFIQVMKQVAAALESRKDQVEQNATVLQNHVKNRLDADAKGVLEPHLDQLHSLAQTVARMIDRENGGFSGAPKFPSAPFMETLFLAAYSSEPSDYRDLFIHSLREMANGGIYDHLGGGLCRYATDSNWLIPHFEKMLYDNAHFIRHCVWAHSFTGEEMFRDRIEKTVSWLEKEMVLESRGIASSLDADSEGEEGKFYVWSKEEVDQVLWEASDVFSLQYEISTAGNWEGKNILHRRHPGADMDENETVLADAKRKLLEKRNLRTRPGLDDKVLVDWNGLMIRSLCEAGRYFRRKDWIDIAKGAFGFIVAKQNGSRLPHSIGKGSILFPGLSSDYSSMMLAAIALHEATGAQDYLDHAKGWARALEEWHGDGNYGFYLTAKDSDDVPIRIRGDSDDAMTSPTGLIIEAIHKLALATGDIKLSVDANRMAASAMGRIAHSQFGQAGIINAAALVLQPIKLVLSGKGQDGIDTVPNRIPDPRRVDVYSGDNATELSDGTLIRPDDGTVYLCLGPVCLPPISDPKQLENALRNPDIPG